ncbi:hypothetical protein MP228_002124 [Amoeboaphelidium protococcarum]|nr:hypothetical protein MP228_002124 [Amoeboaphelidium protococcarum]
MTRLEERMTAGIVQELQFRSSVRDLEFAVCIIEMGSQSFWVQLTGQKENGDNANNINKPDLKDLSLTLMSGSPSTYAQYGGSSISIVGGDQNLCQKLGQALSRDPMARQKVRQLFVATADLKIDLGIGLSGQDDELTVIHGELIRAVKKHFCEQK